MAYRTMYGGQQLPFKLDIYRSNFGHHINENYLCVAWLDIAEEEYHNYEEKSTEEIESTPPSTRYFYTLGQDISEWLSVLENV